MPVGPFLEVLLVVLVLLTIENDGFSSSSSSLFLSSVSLVLSVPHVLPTPSSAKGPMISRSQLS